LPSKIWVELLRSKFKRSTWKLCFMSTEIDLGLKVDIDNPALCQQILTMTLRSTLRILNVDLKVIVKICWRKARSSISTFKPSSKMLVDLLNSTLSRPRKFLVRQTLAKKKICKLFLTEKKSYLHNKDVHHAWKLQYFVVD